MVVKSGAAPTVLQCRVCSSEDLCTVWELAPSPYGDLFRKTRTEALALDSVPLTLQLCYRCGLLQLAEEVDSGEIYLDYIYQSSVTTGLGAFYVRLAGHLIRELWLESGDLIVDVGSNDGTGLRPYSDAGLRVLGVEPSRGPAAAALEAGVATVNDYLSTDVVHSILTGYGGARLVTANYVAANVSHPVPFLSLMRDLLVPGGWISVVTGYHPDQFAVNMFDYINHDHLTYWSVESAASIGRMAGLRLMSATRVEHKGGSVHLLFKRDADPGVPDETVAKLCQREGWLQVTEASTYLALRDRIADSATKAARLLDSVGPTTAAGVGASISTTHLINQFGLDDRLGDLFDDDPNKIGRFSPGLGLRVRPLAGLSSAEADVAVLLAWQHGQTLLRRLTEVGYQGRVLVPLPKPHILTF